MRPKLDIPTNFNSPNVDPALGRDLSRLGSAVEQISQDRSLARVPDTELQLQGGTLALDKVMRCQPPASGTVLFILPAAGAGDENREAELIVTRGSSAIIAVQAPAGSALNGTLMATYAAVPSWRRFKWHGGSWYGG